MSIIVYLHNPSVQNPTEALLVQTPAPSIAHNGDIGPLIADRPHLHLCTFLHPPHHHHLCHVIVGTLTDGYIHTSTLPQVHTKQSAPPSGRRLPPYFGIPVLIPMLRRVIGPAIARVQTPW